MPMYNWRTKPVESPNWNWRTTLTPTPQSSQVPKKTVKSPAYQW
jgi:hypothetical protein